jgi:hypothetical protein
MVANDSIGSGLKLVICGKVMGSMPRSFIIMKVRLANSRNSQMPEAGTMVPSSRL